MTTTLDTFTETFLKNEKKENTDKELEEKETTRLCSLIETSLETYFKQEEQNKKLQKEFNEKFATGDYSLHFLEGTENIITLSFTTKLEVVPLNSAISLFHKKHPLFNLIGEINPKYQSSIMIYFTIREEDKDFKETIGALESLEISLDMLLTLGTHSHLGNLVKELVKITKHIYLKQQEFNNEID